MFACSCICGKNKAYGSLQDDEHLEERRPINMDRSKVKKWPLHFLRYGLAVGFFLRARKSPSTWYYSIFCFDERVCCAGSGGPTAVRSVRVVWICCCFCFYTADALKTDGS